MRSQARKFARINGLDIAVCGEQEVSRFARCPLTHVISIWDTQQASNEETRNWIRSLLPDANIQFAYFNDITRDGYGTGAPTISEIRHILEITKALPLHTSLLVHCRAGVSRSAAIALAIMSQRAGPGHERDCLRALLRVRAHAMPNALIVSLADTILERQGRLTSELDQLPAIFRELLPFI